MKKITFTAHQRAELVETPDAATPLGPRQVRGRTLVSLVSPGTELNWGFLGEKFPAVPGYACVFEVDEVGSEVADLAPGTRVFSPGNHVSRQTAEREGVVPLPEGLAPEKAVFARLMGVSMATLSTTAVRPPARVLVTGLGPVGQMAAQLFALSGYAVTAVDPVEARRATAREAGITDVRAGTGDGPALTDQVDLHVECSGHEQAVLDGCRVVRRLGEVVLVGVPWKRRTELFAQDILHAVFHRYVVLRSGWEWQVPRQPVPFVAHSQVGNYRAALEWIAAGRVDVSGMGIAYAPAEAQTVYEGLLAQTLPTATALFDWRRS